ncbi:hypothetical protein ANANG_G00021630 [Anguilla anguilla]|uniref:Uncharacterized protein n=1 Tax=Anguilla anguilla TaxID=7936 RepID=A0A9D3N1H8_ANGAN|nr:hypothetical protein ANANG_G00021630 [Anguilla anguilla]
MLRDLDKSQTMMSFLFDRTNVLQNQNPDLTLTALMVKKERAIKNMDRRGKDIVEKGENMGKENMGKENMEKRENTEKEDTVEESEKNIDSDMLDL